MKKQIAQNDLPAHDAGQLHLGGRKIDIRPRYPQALSNLAPDVGQRSGVNQHIVHRRAFSVRLDAQVGGGMSLRVQIEHANPLAGLRQGGGQVDRGCRFPNAAFLIDDCDPSHGILLYPFRRRVGRVFEAHR